MATETTSEPGRKRRFSRAAFFYILGALLGTGLSGTTSWRFFQTHLKVENLFELGAMFAVYEVVLFACMLGSWENLNNPAKKSPGAPGIVVWLLAGFAAVPAIEISYPDWGAAAFRVVLGPFMAVFCFHMAMGMGLRHKKPGATSDSPWAVISREMRERLYARLGLATRNQSALQISQARAVEKASILSGRVRSIEAAGKLSGRRGQRTVQRLETQLRLAGVADSPDRADALLRRLSVSRHAVTLSTLDLASPWQGRPAVVSAPGQPDADSRTADVAADSADDWDAFEADLSGGQRTAGQPDTAGADTAAADGRGGQRGQARRGARHVRTSVADTADSQAEQPTESDNVIELPTQRPTVTDVVRAAWSDHADTATFQRIVAEVIPDAKPDSVARAVRRVRTERDRTTGQADRPTGTGQYL